MIRPLVLLTALSFLAAGTLACGDSSNAPSAPAESAAAGQAAGTDLPAGHPPIAGGTGGIVAPPANAGTGSNALTWSPPEDWEWVEPANAMRRAQYRVPGAEGDSECVVYYFGPGQGGDAMSNAVRWANQFTQPDGRSSQEVMKTRNIMVGDISVMLIEVTGSYSGGMPGMGGGGAAQEGQMLLGAVAEGPDANWFFKLTGPEGSVRQQQEGFEAMIRSLTASGDPA